MKVTIVGAGNMGRGIARRMVAGGNEVELVDENPEDSRTLAEELGELATSVVFQPPNCPTAILATSTWARTTTVTETRVAEPCEHLQALRMADFPPPRAPDACEECLAEGARWVALRECLDCGHVGCRDSSPGTHATEHYHRAHHPDMRSVMPGDTWSWCYLHEQTGQLS